jgi:hypothetical protein
MNEFISSILAFKFINLIGHFKAKSSLLQKVGTKVYIKQDPDSLVSGVRSGSGFFFFKGRIRSKIVYICNTPVTFDLFFVSLLPSFFPKFVAKYSDSPVFNFFIEKLAVL